MHVPWMQHQKCRHSCSTQEQLPRKKFYSVFGKGQIGIKIPTLTLNSSIQETTGLQGSKIRSTTGLWIPTISSISHSYLQFVFALDSPRNNPFSMNHFFVSIILHLMDRKIRTYTFIDSGATNSHISDSFVSKHSFPQCWLPIPIPITAVNRQPLSSGLLTHEIFSTLNISDHTERIHLGIISSPYPVILGLDWLQWHNLNINWKKGKMKLTCCNIKYHTVMNSFGLA